MLPTFTVLRLLTLALVAIPTSSIGEEVRPAVGTVTPVEASLLVDAGRAVLVDVREQDEVALGMAAPARWLPKSRVDRDPKLLEAFLQGLPKASEVIFYCAHGKRAQAMAERAVACGRHARNMGGYDGWVAAGLPVKPGPGPSRKPDLPGNFERPIPMANR